MLALLQQLANQLSAWEALAVVLAIAYLLLAMRENSWCWACALGSTAIYTVILWQVSLLMESALNVYYLVMAVYGWWQWRRGGERHQGVAIQSWPLRNHLVAIGAILMLSLTSGYLLASKTAAALPYVDSFTTWGSVITTWMVARKILENWLYWLVIDSVCVFMYFERGLYFSTFLFAAYVVIVVIGYWRWRGLYSAAQPVAA